jgi:hypothetical protein
MQDSLNSVLLDRLVDGELADGDRRDLLLRLSTEPDGWRRCALAFLEAQSWRAALGPVAASMKGSTKLDTSGSRLCAKGRRPALRLAALAAGLAGVFFLGWLVRGSTGQTAISVPGAGTEARSQLVIDQELDSETEKPEVAQPVLIDPAARVWEQQGFRAERQKRLIPIELPDGRKVDVPVQELRVQYVGNRTY